MIQTTHKQDDVNTEDKQESSNVSDLQDEVLEQKITGVDEDGNIDDVEAHYGHRTFPMTEEEEYANAGITKEEAEKLTEIFQRRSRKTNIQLMQKQVNVNM